jgi:uncharacterized protein YgiM (DUF1202 family)
MLKTIIFLCIFFSVYNIAAAQRRCTGSVNCGACTTCSGCKYCNEGGGSCGVCGGGSSYTPPATSRYNSNSRPSYSKPSNSTYSPYSTSNRKTIKVVQANVRTSPSINGQIAGTLKQGAVLTIVYSIGEWYVVTIQGRIYYIHKSVFY